MSTILYVIFVVLFRGYYMLSFRPTSTKTEAYTLISPGTTVLMLLHVLDDCMAAPTPKTIKLCKLEFRE